MGKKLDALLGRNSKRSKVKTMANLAISRIAILKNKHRVRCSQAHSDVVQLLEVGYQERALSRVELVIKEQNTVDAYAIIESYCHALKEKEVLISDYRECPDEYKVVISTLIFAASRCGELPELQEIRVIFTSSFGKDFAARAVELRNNCSMIQKLSTKQASLGNRLRVLKQIAIDNGITLYLELNAPELNTQQKQVFNHTQKQHTPKNTTKLEPTGQDHSSPEDMTEDKSLSESIKARKEYRDVSLGAQDAFKSATEAIVAVRAAVELSQSELCDKDPDNQTGSNNQHFQHDRPSKSRLKIDQDIILKDGKQSIQGFNFGRLHRAKISNSDLEANKTTENSRNDLNLLDHSNRRAGPGKALFASSLDTNARENNRLVSPNVHDQDDSDEDTITDTDDETRRRQESIIWLRYFHSDEKLGSQVEAPNNKNFYGENDSKHYDLSPTVSSKISSLSYDTCWRDHPGAKIHIG